MARLPRTPTEGSVNLQIFILHLADVSEMTYVMSSFYKLLTVRLLTSVSVSHAEETCLGEYQSCDDGTCALTDTDCTKKYCNSSSQSGLVYVCSSLSAFLSNDDPYFPPQVCPISKACVDGPEGYLSCPGLSGTHLVCFVNIHGFCFLNSIPTYCLFF